MKDKHLDRQENILILIPPWQSLLITDIIQFFPLKLHLERHSNYANRDDNKIVANYEETFARVASLSFLFLGFLSEETMTKSKLDRKAAQ